jgi:hypothetical protein
LRGIHRWVGTNLMMIAICFQKMITIWIPKKQSPFEAKFGSKRLD